MALVVVKSLHFWISVRRTEIYFVSEENKEFESELGRTQALLEERIALRRRLEKMTHEAVCALQEVLHVSTKQSIRMMIYFVGLIP